METKEVYSSVFPSSSPSRNIRSLASVNDFFFLFSLAPACMSLRAAVMMLGPPSAVVIFSLVIFLWCRSCLFLHR